jgi:hypothetical protein
MKSSLDTLKEDKDSEIKKLQYEIELMNSKAGDSQSEA